MYNIVVQITWIFLTPVSNSQDLNFKIKYFLTPSLCLYFLLLCIEWFDSWPCCDISTFLRILHVLLFLTKMMDFPKKKETKNIHCRTFSTSSCNSPLTSKTINKKEMYNFSLTNFIIQLFLTFCKTFNFLVTKYCIFFKLFFDYHQAKMYCIYIFTVKNKIIIPYVKLAVRQIFLLFLISWLL